MRLIALPIAVLWCSPWRRRRTRASAPSTRPRATSRCLYRSGGPFLRCDVHSLNDTAFTLDRRHRGKRVHVTDAVPAGRVLPYGATAKLGPFRCRSRTTGLTCRSKPSGHGFKLARERQYTF